MKVKSIIIFYDDIIQIKIDHTQIRENVLSKVWSIDVKIWKLEKNRKNQDYNISKDTIQFCAKVLKLNVIRLFTQLQFLNTLHVRSL